MEVKPLDGQPEEKKITVISGHQITAASAIIKALSEMVESGALSYADTLAVLHMVLNEFQGRITIAMRQQTARQPHIVVPGMRIFPKTKQN